MAVPLVAERGLDVRLREPAAVDVDDTVSLRHYLPGEADDPLHERAALVADRARLRGRVENDDLSAARVAVKATTSERLGFTGRGEGLVAMATATIEIPRED